MSLEIRALIIIVMILKEVGGKIKYICIGEEDMEKS